MPGPGSRLTIPTEIAKTLPSLDTLQQALKDSLTALPIGTPIYRAVRHPAAVIPPFVQRTYRFGPPESVRDAAGNYPFFWLYAAEDLNTALWEAESCRNDITQPGTFYIPEEISHTGLVAVFKLRADMPILDLSGTVLSKLGIYDQISLG